MIFSRRAIQRRLDALRPILGDPETSALADRLNRMGKVRMASMWEAVVLHAFSAVGTIESEKPLPSGRKPDISFADGAMTITADITCPSDDGLNEQNPYRELSELVEAAKTKLGLPSGGVSIEIGAEQLVNSRGTRTVLRLPERKRVREFVDKEIIPRFREQLAAGETTLQVDIEDETAKLRVLVDPNSGPYSYGSYASYNVPTVKTQNPLYNALKSKADQLRDAPGIVGIIVGDGGCRAMAPKQLGAHQYDGRAIAEEFLRQNSSIDFVFLVTVEEDSYHFMQAGRQKRRLHASLVQNTQNDIPAELEALLRRVMEDMPAPIATALNGAERAKQTGFGWGRHGGYLMAGNKITISARELLDVLAGNISVEQQNELNRWRMPDDKSEPGKRVNPFALCSKRGEMPNRITVIPLGEAEDDHMIEFEFAPDPSISRFR